MTESEIYWDQLWSEILSEHGIDLDITKELHEEISKDFAANAEAQGEYSAPIQGDCEIKKLMDKIKKLESRVPCNKCGGTGGYNVGVGSAHYSWSDCIACNGKKWLSS